MTKHTLFLFIRWGIGLWLAGYLLGILFFMIAPATLVGWLIMPIGILMTEWVLLTKVREHLSKQSLWIGAIWMFSAIILDYFFLVKVFKPADGYYKLDVYLYYGSTFILPFLTAQILKHSKK